MESGKNGEEEEGEEEEEESMLYFFPALPCTALLLL
jgi:hypothetical protein